MKTESRYVPGKNFFSMIAAGCMLLAGSTGAQAYQVTLDADTQAALTRAMTLKVNRTIQEQSSDPAVAGKVMEEMMRQGMESDLVQERILPMMMERVRTAVRADTAERKRDQAVDTCLQCRVNPVRVTVTGRTALLDAETQALINERMAAKVQATVDENASDVEIVRTVQARMMEERMQSDFLQEKVRPILTAQVRGAVREKVAEMKRSEPVRACMQCRGAVDATVLVDGSAALPNS